MGNKEYEFIYNKSFYSELIKLSIKPDEENKPEKSYYLKYLKMQVLTQLLYPIFLVYTPQCIKL